MICKELYKLVSSALASKLGDKVKIKIGDPPPTPEKGSLYIRIPEFDFTRRRFSSSSEDKSQRLTISVNIVYYPIGEVHGESGRLEIFSALGKVYLSGSDCRLESYSASANRDHFDITVGYSLTLAFFGLS